MHVYQIKNSWWQKGLYYLYHLPQNIYNYSKSKVEKYGAEYTPFAFFMAFNYMFPLFMRIEPGGNIIYTWLLIIKTIGVSLCIGLLLKPYWASWFQKYFPIYWHFTLFYCIPFSFTLLFLINGSNIQWLVNVALAIMLLILLVDWTTFLTLSILGTITGIWFYTQFIGKTPVFGLYDLYILLHVCLFSMAIGFIFARRREISMQLMFQQNRQLQQKQQETRQELASAIQYREQMLQDLDTNEVVTIFDDITAAYLQHTIYRMTDYMRLDVTSVNLEELFKEVIMLYNSQGFEQPQVIFKKQTEQNTLQADFGKLKQLLFNAISYVRDHNKDHNPINVVVSDAQLGHKVAHMKGYVRELPALEITITTGLTQASKPQQPLYMIDPSESNLWVPQQEDEFLLLENARIIDAHYGYIAERSAQKQMYVLPIPLREIRGNVMELIAKPTKADPEEAKHPMAIQLEKELMERLQGTQVDLKIIKKGLDIIKRYHAGMKRKSGEPFFTHPIAVALILLDYSQDQDAILGALLHDTVEDTSLSFVQIRALFGRKVEFLVIKATNLEEYERRVSLTDKENLVRILNYEDPRAALVKLSDRLHNMRTIQYHSSLDKQKSIAQETLEYFVPLAKKLGIEKMATELEDLSRSVLAK
ncbi:MAG: hypothetical protein BGO68_03710 [Candidatus Amoebophilus sp. 36-38]|nr:MAG: hypothetical protein BGO68_03710 [Candidatus Amoebophilus sp. 36-38]